MCTSSKSVHKEQFRYNVNGGKVMFEDRSHTGPNGKVLVTELSLQQSGASVLGTSLMFAFLTGVSCYVIWIFQVSI